jgi:hypothetical protein
MFTLKQAPVALIFVGTGLVLACGSPTSAQPAEADMSCGAQSSGMDENALSGAADETTNECAPQKTQQASTPGVPMGSEPGRPATPRREMGSEPEVDVLRRELRQCENVANDLEVKARFWKHWFESCSPTCCGTPHG